MLTNTKRFLQGNRISGYNDTDAMQDRRDTVHSIGGKAYLFDPKDAEEAIRRKMEENAQKRKMKQSGYDFRAEVRKMRA